MCALSWRSQDARDRQTALVAARRTDGSVTGRGTGCTTQPYTSCMNLHVCVCTLSFTRTGTSYQRGKRFTLWLPDPVTDPAPWPQRAGRRWRRCAAPAGVRRWLTAAGWAWGARGTRDARPAAALSLGRLRVGRCGLLAAWLSRGARAVRGAAEVGASRSLRRTCGCAVSCLYSACECVCTDGRACFREVRVKNGPGVDSVWCLCGPRVCSKSDRAPWRTTTLYSV